MPVQERDGGAHCVCMVQRSARACCCVDGCPAGTDFDHNVKHWRIFADVLNDVAIFIELIAPSFPSAFVPLVCLSSLFKVWRFL